MAQHAITGSKTLPGASAERPDVKAAFLVDPVDSTSERCIIVDGCNGCSCGLPDSASSRCVNDSSIVNAARNNISYLRLLMSSRPHQRELSLPKRGQGPACSQQAIWYAGCRCHRPVQSRGEQLQGVRALDALLISWAWWIIVCCALRTPQSSSLRTQSSDLCHAGLLWCGGKR